MGTLPHRVIYKVGVLILFLFFIVFIVYFPLRQWFPNCGGLTPSEGCKYLAGGGEIFQKS
jgi:hypothetical protein